MSTCSPIERWGDLLRHGFLFACYCHDLMEQARTNANTPVTAIVELRYLYAGWCLAEGPCHRSLGQRPRNASNPAVFWPKAIFTSAPHRQFEYGLRPNDCEYSDYLGRRYACPRLR